jgi:hypothetical protein
MSVTAEAFNWQDGESAEQWLARLSDISASGLPVPMANVLAIRRRHAQREVERGRTGATPARVKAGRIPTAKLQATTPGGEGQLTALEEAKRAYARLGARDRATFIRWLTFDPPPPKP